MGEACQRKQSASGAQRARLRASQIAGATGHAAGKIVGGVEQTNRSAYLGKRVAGA